VTHRVIAMVVLRRQAEDGKRPAFVFRRLVAVVVSEHAPDRELATLDPDRGGLVNGLEEHGAALNGEELVNVMLLEKHVDQRSETHVGARDDSTGIFGIRDRSSVGFQLALRACDQRRTPTRNA
jgi:hypothetical protein